MGLLLQVYDNIIWEMLQTLCVLQSSANTSPVIGGMCHYKKNTRKDVHYKKTQGYLDVELGKWQKYGYETY